MSEPFVEIGDKLHVITRRLFDGDVRRHFAGEVIGIDRPLHKLGGHAFIFNASTNRYVKRPEPRTRVFLLGDAGLIVLGLPREVEIAALDYHLIDGQLCLTDGNGFVMDINEFGMRA